MIKTDKEAYLIGKVDSEYIGDDAAMVEGKLYSSDAFFEDIHFKRAWMSLKQIARKAMLVNFSDAIAMNAHPQYALLTLSIPRHLTRDEIDELMEGFAVTAEEFGCKIIGGDTVGGDKLHISVTVISKSEAPLYRKGLQAGDLLAYTGTLGQSKRDLTRLFAGERIEADSRFYEPVLRARFIKKARPWLRVGMDISDGLFCDTNKLLDINKYDIDILKNIDDKTGSSGEEYEMLIGFEKKHLQQLENLAERLETPLTVFAEVVENGERFPCKSHHF